MSAYAIYTRASEIGADGVLSSDPAEQEAAARAWAAQQQDVEIVDVVAEVASGRTAADDRALGGLIRRVESGEIAGIVVRDERRFARNLIEGSLALKRVDVAGGRLVATMTGFDSANLNSQSMLVFNIMLSVAEAEAEKNLEARMNAKARFVERGGYAAIAPFGYDRVDGRLVANADADRVRDAFRLRAERVGFSEIGRQLGLTRGHARKIVMNRAYVGEQRIPDPQRRAHILVVCNSHPPIVTEGEWQAANAVRGRAPIRRGLSAGVTMKGIVKCGVCSRPMAVLSYGARRDKLTYACTRPRCGAASMKADNVETVVAGSVYDAIMEDEPHVAATLADDDRYDRALAAVEQAQTALADYRDNIELQTILGVQDWAAGLRVRTAAVEEARRALRSTPRPAPISDAAVQHVLPVERVVADVFVYPKSAAHRLTLRWHGAERAVPVA